MIFNIIASSEQVGTLGETMENESTNPTVYIIENYFSKFQMHFLVFLMIKEQIENTSRLISWWVIGCSLCILCMESDK